MRRARPAPSPHTPTHGLDAEFAPEVQWESSTGSRRAIALGQAAASQGQRRPGRANARRQRAVSAPQHTPKDERPARRSQFRQEACQAGIRSRSTKMPTAASEIRSHHDRAASAYTPTRTQVSARYTTSAPHFATSEALGDVGSSDVAAVIPEYRVFMNAGHPPTAISGRSRDPRIPRAGLGTSSDRTSYARTAGPPSYQISLLPSGLFQVRLVGA